MYDDDIFIDPDEKKYKTEKNELDKDDKLDNESSHLSARRQETLDRLHSVFSNDDDELSHNNPVLDQTYIRTISPRIERTEESKPHNFEAKRVIIPRLTSKRQKKERINLALGCVAVLSFFLVTAFGLGKLFFNEKKVEVISSTTTNSVPLFEDKKAKVYNYNVNASEWDDHQYKFTAAHYYEKYIINYNLIDFKKAKISRDSSKSVYWNLYINENLVFENVHKLELQLVNGYLFVYYSYLNEVGNNLVVFDSEGKEYFNLQNKVKEYKDIDLNPEGIRAWSSDFKADTLNFKVYSKVGSRPTVCDNNSNMIIYLEFKMSFVDNKFNDLELMETMKTNKLCGKEDNANELEKTL